jgi:hypothetical protein
MPIRAWASSSKPRSHRVILREAEPVHIEADRGLDARDVKHVACEPVGHRSTREVMPPTSHTRRSHGFGLLLTLFFVASLA